MTQVNGEKGLNAGGHVKPIHKGKWIAGIAIILTLFLFVPTYLAGPDGLERVMEDQGVEAPTPIWNGLLTDYTIPGIDDPFLSGLLAGFAGITITFFVIWVFVAIKKSSKKPEPRD